MKLNRLALLLVGIGAATQSFAGDRIAEIAAENPTASPDQVLEHFYQESELPASLSDFDLNTDTHSTQRCVAADKDLRSPYVIYFVRAEAVVKPGVPAEPAQGPLFPAKPAIPDEMGSVLLFNSTGRNVLDSAISTIGATEKITTSATDLIVTLTDTKPVILEGLPVVAQIRKNQGLIAIKLTVYANESYKNTVFAYCYR